MVRKRTIPALAPAGLSDVEQACSILGISRPTLYRYMKENDFPEAVKHLGKTWFKTEALKAWKQSRIGSTTNTPAPKDAGEKGE